MNKLKLLNLNLTQIEPNLLEWSEIDLFNIVGKDNIIVGYILKPKSTRFSLTLYITYYKYVSDVDRVVTLSDLKIIYKQWQESLTMDPNSFMFRNPPLDLWLETKLNWVKKISYQLSESYNKPMDECMSTLYMTILNCYNKSNIYLGNLHYIIIAAHNAMKLEHRYMLNRLYGNHPLAIHLDAVPSDFNASLDDSVASMHELIDGLTDAFYEEERDKAAVEELLLDLQEEFTTREIDQIINTPSFLPKSLYRRLLKWRKTRKLEDYYE